ncbi:M23 family metallopeptidase [Dactylosporangium sp. CA-139066]|uniref:M23 family metallopeptidase n=1 Tax=Dactylosporangium sp. CA-139066 TaxID=3239930 RepID=UPI003D901E91
MGGVGLASSMQGWFTQQQEAPPASDCGGGQLQVHDASAVKADGFTATQVANATAIVRTGQQMQVPPRGWVIAVATAMQESNLHNLANPGVPSSMALPHEGSGRDHDSVGLFQQRPSPPEGAGSWGTVQDLMTPATSARKFYDALQRVSGWQSLSLTQAAQRVQRSAFPGAYAKHEPRAAALVGAVSGGADLAGQQPGQCAAPAEVTAGGWVRPVSGEVGSPFGPRGGRLHAGVDLMASRRTPIRAASSGTVIKAVCDASTARTVGTCDRDGSPSAAGCGWFVDIQHAAGIITRYCHMTQRPAVSAGEHVAAGQQIGIVGSSGHSSGPHLHFEVHLNNDRSPQGAVNPVPFMREHGAALGA